MVHGRWGNSWHSRVVDESLGIGRTVGDSGAIDVECRVIDGKSIGQGVVGKIDGIYVDVVAAGNIGTRSEIGEVCGACWSTRWVPVEAGRPVGGGRNEAADPRRVLGERRY